MTLSNAERQARYRERHLRRGGGKRRIQLFVNIPTKAKARLSRLARHKCYSLTALIEEWAAPSGNFLARAGNFLPGSFHQIAGAQSRRRASRKRTAFATGATLDPPRASHL